MESITFDKVLRHGFEVLLLFLNALLLLIPGLQGGLTEHVDASTFVVALLSFFLCALGGLLDLCKEDALPYWYISPRKTLLYKAAIALLLFSALLSFGLCLLVGLVSATDENGAIFAAIILAAFIATVPYLGLRLSILSELIHLALNKAHGIYPQIVDYIGPMLRRLGA